ncbi:hypothetical protein N7520_002489 [Penicillium odoratum]|uniref:uncharacterized protein n=1 Tax=Penicillium odoratum TaxID=1167516 RepID=UPI002548AE43|nr:uncharacterized protein N7520_002489 [Penicillium odoratum]KAJ5771960.1 hypothetical protein N7520_002489 [Penicillium odoratum]
MRYIYILAALAASAIAMPTVDGNKGDDEDWDDDNDNDKPTCDVHQTVVCSGNGNGGLLSLGNLLNGLLGESCSGNVYCCDSEDVNQVGLINLNLDLQCSLNNLL